MDKSSRAAYDEQRADDSSMADTVYHCGPVVAALLGF